MPLFVYGVLLGSVAEGRVRELVRGFGPGQPATSRGLLYAVSDEQGAYPVLVPGDGEVHGAVHDLGTADLASLDRFEDADHDSGEYQRGLITARLAGGGEAQAWAYLYNRPLTPDLIMISHGNFARWLRESGIRPYGG